jgi:hypothetical protein
VSKRIQATGAVPSFSMVMIIEDRDPKRPTSLWILRAFQSQWLKRLHSKAVKKIEERISMMT